MALFGFQKSALAISSAAALVALLAAPVQAANDAGELIINGQVSNTTCLLTLGDNGASGSNSRTLNLGTFPIGTPNGAVLGTPFGTAITAILGLKAADGVNPCTFTDNATWDVGINIDPNNYVTVSGVTYLKNAATTGGATNLGVLLKTSNGTAATTSVGATNVDLRTGSPTYGTLLSGSTVSGPNVLPANVIAVTAQFVRTGTTVAAGVWTHSIPLTVWYK